MTTSSSMVRAARALTGKGKRLLCANFDLAAILNGWQVKAEVSGKSDPDFLLVYQMSKVGSSSILSAIRSRLPDTPVFHVHALRGSELRRMEAIYRSSWRDKTRRPKHPNAPVHLWHGRFLEKQLAGDWRQRRWRIVTLFRDPVARVISAFFEVLHLEFGYDYNTLIKQRPLGEVVKGAQALFLQKFAADSEDFTMAWFDKELKAIFGVDVAASPFPRDLGYAIYHQGPVDVLVLKLEKLNQCAPAAFSAFLGFEQFEIQRANEGASKDYKAVYRSFLDSFRLPAPFLEKVYRSKMVRTFYDDEEIEAFQRRWAE